MHSTPGSALGQQDGPTVSTDPQLPGGARAWTEDPEAGYRELFEATQAAPVVDPDQPIGRSRRNRRRLRVAVVVALLLVLGAAGGAWAWTSHARKQPALDALRSGNAAFEPVATKLRLASDMEALRIAAGRAAAAADRVDAAARPIAQPSSDLERRVREVLRDEAAVLHASVDIGTLEIESLAGWPEVRDSIAKAESDLGGAVKRLAKVEPDLTNSLVTGRALAAHSDEVVGDFASTSMTDLLVARISELTGARTTADLRAIATRTTSAGQVVALALKGVDPQGPQGKQITAVATALKALGGLGTITADKLTAWTGVRAQLAAATTGLEGVDSRNALSAVDGLVTRAQQQLARWRATTARLTARTAKDTKALTTYTTAVQAALTSQVAANAADAAFVTGVGKNPELTSQQAIAYLDGATKTRAAVSAALAAATPPKALREQHAALVQLAEQSTETVASGYQGTKKTRCGKVPPTTPGGKPTPAPCLYAATGGWTSFSSGTAQATPALTAARKTWGEAVTAAQKAIAARKLPTKPVV